MDITRHWRLKTQRYRLEGSICPVCGQVTFPPRPVCVTCDYGAHSTRVTGYGPLSIPEVTATPITNRIMFQINLKG
jgi:uncharacterized OB-fold protein